MRELLYNLYDEEKKMPLQTQLLCDDQVHLEPGQPQAHDEHAQGEGQEHPVRGLPRLQGMFKMPNIPWS